MQAFYCVYCLGSRCLVVLRVDGKVGPCRLVLECVILPVGVMVLIMEHYLNNCRYKIRVYELQRVN